ncbi:hypothetical protein AYM40_33650 [Paraburkholderia phytofirmans OLGA172]|uniref:Uncharacterized protein n=1 Tax=Paraburkholderia phytofirmans OLGA172 TaxID=1417228 RepID=A0A160FVB4_9BURK|nr:hypothetical protein [Paraburkholderia phytofirmans]ANB77062.1 hypothetical protein AYM40_33650 [Paraburkholderia phytofirmans OLGA172]
MVETDVYKIIPPAIVAQAIRASLLVLPPAAERAFHIVEVSSNFRSIIFPRFENMFHIAIIIVYLIEK